MSKPETQPSKTVVERQALTETKIAEHPKLAPTMRIVKGMLEKEGEKLNLSPDDLCYTQISEHDGSLTGISFSWKKNVSGMRTQAGVMIKIPGDLEGEMPKDRDRKIDHVVNIHVFSGIDDDHAPKNLYGTYGDHKLVWCRPESFEADPALQEQLRKEIGDGLPQALADMEKLPELLAKENEWWRDFKKACLTSLDEGKDFLDKNPRPAL